MYFLCIHLRHRTVSVRVPPAGRFYKKRREVTGANTLAFEPMGVHLTELVLCFCHCRS